MCARFVPSSRACFLAFWKFDPATNSSIRPHHSPSSIFAQCEASIDELNSLEQYLEVGAEGGAS